MEVPLVYRESIRYEDFQCGLIIVQNRLEDLPGEQTWLLLFHSDEGEPDPIAKGTKLYVIISTVHTVVQY